MIWEFWKKNPASVLSIIIVININIMLVEITKLKAAGLLFAVGCVTTSVLSYYVMISWWQQTYISELTVSCASSIYINVLEFDC